MNKKHIKTGLVLGLIIGMFFYLPNVITKTNISTPQEILIPFLITVGYTLLMYWLYPRLGKWKPGSSDYYTFLLFYLAGISIGIIQYFIHRFISHLLPQFDFTDNIPQGFDFAFYSIFMQVRYLFINSIILFVLYSDELNSRNKRIQIEKEKLKQEHLAAQYEALKQKLNPHFLFNSLNSLKSVAASNPEKTEPFIISLSNVYRYLLSHQENKLVRLSDEIEFIINYIFLLKIRFENTILIDLKVDDAAGESLIPPLTIQLLLENAVKHNIATSRKPLTIVIWNNGHNSLTVSNSLQEKAAGADSTNTGLHNLNQRYELFGFDGIEIRKAEGCFTVTVPLITKVYEHSYH